MSELKASPGPGKFGEVVRLEFDGVVVMVVKDEHTCERYDQDVCNQCQGRIGPVKYETLMSKYLGAGKYKGTMSTWCAVCILDAPCQVFDVLHAWILAVKDGVVDGNGGRVG